MTLNEKQSKQIYEFIMKYNLDVEFKNSIQKIYDYNAYKLPILYIYALEDVLRYGTKEIFRKFLETKGTYSDEQAVDLYDEFIKLLNEDKAFEQYKIQQLTDSPDTLSEMEKFVFSLISQSSDKKNQMHEQMTDNLEYDPFNPILYSTDRQIRETLENLFLGELIYKMLELPDMKPIKARQKENGKIANIDKPLIIEKIRSTTLSKNFMSQFKQVIDNRYVKAKMDILLGKGENAFEQYLKYNTNISANEILGREKDYSSDEMFNLFMEMIKKHKNSR